VVYQRVFAPCRREPTCRLASQRSQDERPRSCSAAAAVHAARSSGVIRMVTLCVRGFLLFTLSMHDIVVQMNLRVKRKGWRRDMEAWR
jgi:hypothetical protein